MHYALLHYALLHYALKLLLAASLPEVFLGLDFSLLTVILCLLASILCVMGFHCLDVLLQALCLTGKCDVCGGSFVTI